MFRICVGDRRLKLADIGEALTKENMVHAEIYNFLLDNVKNSRSNY